MKKDTRVPLTWAWHPESGRMRHVDSVPNGKESGCVCTSCGDALVAKQGNVREHHFSHASSGQTGGRETCLHRNGVEALHQRFQDAIQQGEAVPFRWECNACEGEHTHDFAEGMTCAEREKRAPDSLKRPDISLYSGDDLRHLIEVVVYHKPEQSVREYARERRMNLVVVDMKEDPDLHGTIKVELLEGDFCPNISPDAPDPLAELKKLLCVGFDLMADRYEKEFVDFPDIRGIPILNPVPLREGQYAVGVFEQVKWPTLAKAYARVYLRHLEDRRFVLPVGVRQDCAGLRNEALRGRVVLVSCTYVGEGVRYRDGTPYRKWRFGITPLEVDPDTGEILMASE